MYYWNEAIIKTKIMLLLLLLSLLLQTTCISIKCFPNLRLRLRIKLRFGQRLGSWFVLVIRIVGVGFKMIITSFFYR